MINRNLLFVLWITLCSFGHLWAQTEPPPIGPNDIPSLTITRNETFDGEGLWGYIDGGADIYLEYGFEKVRVLECLIDSMPLKADIYKMKSPEAAFGIFSVSRFKCGYNPGLSLYNCITANQVQIARGKYYISVVNEGGTEEQGNASLLLAKKLLEKINDEEMEIPYAYRVLPARHTARYMKYINGNLGLENGMPEWSALFKGIQSFSFFVVPGEDPRYEALFAVVEFPDETSAKLFHQNAGFKKIKQEQNIKVGAKTASITMITPERFIYREEKKNR